MASDRSLLSLEKSICSPPSAASSLRIPSAARSTARSEDEENTRELAETLLSGGDATKLDELSAKVAGYITVVPEPEQCSDVAGICVKVKTKDGKKVFINICTSDKVPPLSKDVSEEELAAALQASEITFRVPMSIGELHEEADHGGLSCSVYDVAISPTLFVKIQASELFHHFFVSIALEGLEEKFAMELDRNSVVLLKGKKVFGKILEQRIRTKPRLITEVNNTSSISRSLDSAPLIPPTDFFLTPDFQLWRDGEQLTADVELPLLTSGKNMDVLLADDRIRLLTRGITPKNYRLEVFLPMLIQSAPAKVDASFDKDEKVLRIVAPIAPNQG